MKMTQKQKTEYDKLYDYLKFELMGFEETQSLSYRMVQNLLNLYLKINLLDDEMFSFTDLLEMFRQCSELTKKAKSKNMDDTYYFNYCCKIVENYFCDTFASEPKQPETKSNKEKAVKPSKKKQKENPNSNKIVKSVTLNITQAEWNELSEKCIRLANIHIGRFLTIVIKQFLKDEVYLLADGRGLYIETENDTK